MSKWYPLTFQPILKEKIWGGNRLGKLKGLENPKENLGESWEISAVHDNISIVANGTFQGKSLKELLMMYPTEIMGSDVVKKHGTEFPLLIKFLDTATDLSIQVHPDDKTAMEKHNSPGKTEMWYIMHADTDAAITLGFKEDCDESAFAKAIQNNSLSQILNTFTVEKDQAFIVRARTVHAIGGGITLAEIQQSSDVTYRVHDYSRTDVDGNKRELHIKESMQVADYDKATGYDLSSTTTASGRTNLVSTQYFITDSINFENEIELQLTADSFYVIMNLGAVIEIKLDGDNYKCKQAQTFLIPAIVEKVTITAQQAGHLLLIHL
jgi:mannose-6-phosphate isomerase